MAYALKGTIYIPSDEFWTFVFNTVPVTNALAGSLEANYNEESGEIEITDTLTASTHCIEGVDFWNFVHDYFPNKGSETRFGVPKFKRHDVIIEVALGSEAPEGWVDSFRPDWLDKSR